MFKKALAAILALVMVIGLLPVLPASTTAFAQIFGECGDHLSWTFEDGTLYITGNGNMYNYNGGNPAPWY